jgi:hypothetical protein
VRPILLWKNNHENLTVKSCKILTEENSLEKRRLQELV